VGFAGFLVSLFAGPSAYIGSNTSLVNLSPMPDKCLWVPYSDVLLSGLVVLYGFVTAGGEQVGLTPGAAIVRSALTFLVSVLLARHTLQDESGRIVRGWTDAMYLSIAAILLVLAVRFRSNVCKVVAAACTASGAVARIQVAQVLLIPSVVTVSLGLVTSRYPTGTAAICAVPDPLPPDSQGWPQGLDRSSQGAVDAVMASVFASEVLGVVVFAASAAMAFLHILRVQGELAATLEEDERIAAADLKVAVGSVSHEARGPLSAALLSLELLDDDVFGRSAAAATGGSPRPAILNELSHSILASKRHLDDLLQWEGEAGDVIKQEATPTWYAPGPEVRHAERMFQGACDSSGIRFIVRSTPRTPTPRQSRSTAGKGAGSAQGDAPPAPASTPAALAHRTSFSGAAARLISRGDASGSFGVAPDPADEARETAFLAAMAAPGGLIFADSGLAMSAITNAVSNSVKHCPDVGGRIVLRVVVVSGDDAFALSGLDQSAFPAYLADELARNPDATRGVVQVEVADNGQGIPADVLASDVLYQPFTRLRDGDESRRMTSSGLGLSIVRRAVVDSMGGAVGLASREGQGTVAFIRFPVLVRPDDRTPVAGATPSPGAGRGLSVRTAGPGLLGTAGLRNGRVATEPLRLRPGSASVSGEEATSSDGAAPTAAGEAADAVFTLSQATATATGATQPGAPASREAAGPSSAAAADASTPPAPPGRQAGRRPRRERRAPRSAGRDSAPAPSADGPSAESDAATEHPSQAAETSPRGPELEMPSGRAASPAASPTDAAPAASSSDKFAARAERDARRKRRQEERDAKRDAEAKARSAAPPPETPTSAAHFPVRARLRVPSSLLGARAFVVDDERINRTMTAALLRRWGLEVTAFEDGQQFIDALAASVTDGGTPPVFVTLDVAMPVCDGFQAMEGAGALVRSGALPALPPVVAVTGNATKADTRRMLDLGCRAVLHKPVDTEALYAQLLRTVGMGPGAE